MNQTDILDIIDRRIRYHKTKQKQAEGRYHSAALSVSEKQRQTELANVAREQAILNELEELRREITEGGEPHADDE